MISRLTNPYEKWGVALTSNVNKRFSKWNFLLADSNQDWNADPFFVFVENQLFIITEKFIYKRIKRRTENKISNVRQKLIKQKNFILYLLNTS